MKSWQFFLLAALIFTAPTVPPLAGLILAMMYLGTAVVFGHFSE